MANIRTKKAIEKVMKTVGEPMTTAQILGRLSDARYKNIPSMNAAGQILARDKRFVKVEYNVSIKLNLWQLKEETQ